MLRPIQFQCWVDIFILYYHFFKGTLLAKKKLKVKFTDEEITLVLRAYSAHPTSWTDVITDVKANCDRLSDATKHLYITATTTKLGTECQPN